MPSSLNLTRSHDLHAAACRLIPGGSQTNSKRAEGNAPGVFPIFAERGRGARVWDVDGNEYVDYILALGPITLGYCYEPVDAAVRAQLEKGIIFGLLHPVEVEAAQALSDMIPCAEMVRFLKGGSEVTTAAARIARAYTGREVILNCGYRGWADTWTAAAANDRGVPGCLKATIATFPYNDLERVRALFTRHKGQVAAVFIDPISVTLPAPGFLEGLREVCHEHGALLVFDEIVTGARLAPGGAQEHFGVTPDLACFAKGIANGMPVGVVCGRGEVMSLAQDLLISVTYGGECLSLAAVVACCHEYTAKPVHQHIWAQGTKLMGGFAALGEQHGVPFRCDGLAPMSQPGFHYSDPALNTDVWTLFLQETAKRGVLIRRGGLLFITFSHTDADVDRTLAAVDDALGLIAGAVVAGDVRGQLQASQVTEGFRRF
jgi:glutamate-1-semialdehyde aminotransferase